MQHIERVRPGWSATLALLLTTAALGTAPAGADPVKCQDAIAKANTKFLQAITKATDKCENAIVKDGGGTCPDDKMTAAIDKATAKLESAIAKGCGGSDRVCNGDASDEELPADVGWPGECPNIASEDCDGRIRTCADITTCLECLGSAATRATSELAYDALVLPSADATLEKCQATIGKANAAYLRSASKALAKCWQARLKGKHTNACEPPDIGDGKYLDAIAKADTKRTSSIGKACGGADKTVGGMDDLSPAAIGFPSSCPNATVPGGPACGGAVGNLTALVGCLDCVTDASVACDDRAAVPGLAAYPPECAACLAPPTTGPCPTALALVADGDRVDWDIGFNGFTHDAALPSNNGVTVAVSGCTGSSHPTCGECAINGPITGAGGPSDVSQRCRDRSSIACTTDPECAVCVAGPNAGALCSNASECPSGTCGAGPCVMFFGPPQGVLGGGLGFCVMNELAAPVSGTLNLTDGSAAATLALQSRVFPGSSSQPCPACVAGTCDGGLREGEACTVQGDGLLMPNVTLDCPPFPGSTFVLGTSFSLTTGQETRTVSAANPACRQTGYTSLQCLCDTCNNSSQGACSSNGDCPASGGAPGVCGGRRCLGGPDEGQPCNACLGGTNNGAPCANASACPGGTCAGGCTRVCSGGPNAGATCSTSSECPGAACPTAICSRPGEPTQPNSCSDDTSTPGLDGCQATSSGEGECAAGPNDGRCSVDIFESCITDGDCVPGPGCPECTTADQFCQSLRRPCFPDNGVIGNSVVAIGKPGAPCEGTARPVLSGLSCVAPTDAVLVNVVFGLPGLSRLRLPVDFTP